MTGVLPGGEVPLNPEASIGSQRATLYNLEKESSDPAGGELDHLLDVNKPALLVAEVQVSLLCHVLVLQH